MRAALSTARPQTNERPCQTRFDHSLLDSEVLGDLLQRHSGEAMEDKDISIAGEGVGGSPAPERGARGFPRRIEMAEGSQSGAAVDPYRSLDGAQKITDDLVGDFGWKRHVRLDARA